MEAGGNAGAVPAVEQGKAREGKGAPGCGYPASGCDTYMHKLEMTKKEMKMLFNFWADRTGVWEMSPHLFNKNHAKSKSPH